MKISTCWLAGLAGLGWTSLMRADLPFRRMLLKSQTRTLLPVRFALETTLGDAALG